VHPGYGFLSERGAFAEAVERAGLTWVGPAAGVLRSISSKCYCRRLADGVGAPVIPGTLSPVTDAEAIQRYGREHGWPVFLKLDKGGGGKDIERIEGVKSTIATGNGILCAPRFVRGEIDTTFFEEMIQ
jgi:acetyl-CoA carboxylase biotin carboxylase subunit